MSAAGDVSEAVKARQASIDRLAVTLLLAYVCLLPLSWSPLPSNIQWVDLLFLPLLAITIAARPAFRRTRLDVLVLIYLAASLPSFIGTAELRPGVIQFAKAVYLAVLYGVVAALSGRARLEADTIYGLKPDTIGQVWLKPDTTYATYGLVPLARIARWLAALGGVVGVVCLMAVAGYYVAGTAVPRLGVVMPLPYVGRFYRLYGPFPSPEYLVNFLAFTTPLVIAQTMRSRPGGARFVWAAALLGILAAACLTIGHGIAGLAVAAALSLARIWRHHHPVLTGAAVAAAFALVLAVNVLLVVAVRDVTMSSSRNMAVAKPPYPYAVHDEQQGAPSVKVEVTYNVMAYWLLKRLALDVFLRKPLVGVGLGAFHAETRRAAIEGQIPSDYREHDPHSTWFGRLAETGLIGTTALAVLWIGILTHAARVAAAGGPQAGDVAALMAGLVGVLVNSLNVDVMHFRFIWLAFGALRGVALGA